MVRIYILIIILTKNKKPFNNENCTCILAVQNERVARHGTKRVMAPSQIHCRTSPASAFRNLSMNKYVKLSKVHI